jgi:hypothetical protein
MLEGREMLANDVLMYHNDPAGTGQASGESLLSAQNVNAGQFGKLFLAPLDGEVYAQPLYIAGVQITSGDQRGSHDVVIAATEHDSLYTIDARSGATLWKASFIDPARNITTVPSSDVLSESISPELGVTSTPVIDPSTGTVYVEARTKEIHGGQTHYVHRLHAIDISSGSEKLGGPLVLADTILNSDGSYSYVSGPAINGTGDGAIGGVITFNAVRQHQRAALTLANGTVYLAFASLGDNGPYHGWILGVDAQSLTLVSAFNTTPNGSAGGIWQSGAGLTSDAQGNLYVATGNGTFDTSLGPDGMPILGDYGDSVLKLAADPTSRPTQPNANGWGLKVVDFFTPSDEQALSASDADLGSGGVLVLPDSAGSDVHRHLLVVADKAGSIYLLDRDQLGGFDAASDHVIQEWPELPHGGFDAPAYYQGAVYYGGVGDQLKRFMLSAGAISVTPDSASAVVLGSPGSTVSISSSDDSGIAWVLDPGSDQLLAFDAANLARQLYGSDDAPGNRDLLGAVVKFSVPTIAHGQVFAGTTNALVVYGLLDPGNAAAPTAGQAIAVSGIEGAPLNAVTLARFTVGSGAANAGAFHAAINWGDGAFSSGTIAWTGGSFQVSGSHAYADEGAWPLTITISSPAGAITLSGQARVAERLMPDGSPGSPNDRFLSEAYDDLLGRPLDAGGWSYWQGMISPSSNRLAIALALESSDEFRQREVQRLFSRFLGRLAEQDAAEFFGRQLAAGVTVEQVAAQLLASTEYFQQFGGGVNSRFLNVVYRDLFGRAIDPGASLFWGRALSGGYARADFVHAAMASDEYRQRTVEEMYQSLLDRPADATGAAAFVAWLRQGGRQEQVAATIVASDEFFAKIADS